MRKLFGMRHPTGVVLHVGDRITQPAQRLVRMPQVYLQFRYRVVRAWQQPLEQILAGGSFTSPSAASAARPAPAGTTTPPTASIGSEPSGRVKPGARYGSARRWRKSRGLMRATPW